MGLDADGMECNHLDGVKTNNCLSNLEWVTARENIAHAIAGGLRGDFAGERNPQARLTEDVVKKIRGLYATGEYTQVVLGDRFGVAPNTIGNVIRGDRWAHVGGPVA